MNEAEETHPASAPQPAPDMRLMESEALRMLASGVDENDVLLVVCGQTGWTWPVAQDYLRRLVTDRRQELARRRLPLASVISLAALAVGAALLGVLLWAA